MKALFHLLITAIWLFFTLLWTCRRRKALILAYPTHSNLGDQAQYYCTQQWIKMYFPDCKTMSIPPCLIIPGKTSYFFTCLNVFCYGIMFLGLRLFLREEDVLFGHSGYFFVDHHAGWSTFGRALIDNPRNRMIILPQTVNFYAPVFKKIASDIFSNRKNLLLLCRDEVSFGKAQETFPGTKLLLFPDIVTSLIGKRTFKHAREGVLFCMRNDIESFYPPDQIEDLRAKFRGIETELTDTSTHVSVDVMNKNRESLIWDKIESFAKFKVIITDRYHGTIFAQIAATPVIVVSSADHKLSSGVKWFPQEHFEGYIYYAKDLEEAYHLAIKILQKGDYSYSLPSYFEEKYWSNLRSLI